MTCTFSAKTRDDFDRVRFIMVRPSHPGNVGSTARAIKTMGFHDLVLVAPPLTRVAFHPSAVAMASGATDVLNRLTELPTLEAALADTTLAFALTARPRDLGPPASDIRQAANTAQQHLQHHATGQISFVLGTESAGLNNQEISLCQRICHIPANEQYSSLNVSQAAQLVAWELRYALASAQQADLLPHTHGAPDMDAEPASGAEIHGFIEHLEKALIATRFLDPDHPRKSMLRLRYLFSRCDLTKEETRMLRGICKAMIKSANSGQ